MSKTTEPTKTEKLTKTTEPTDAANQTNSTEPTGLIQPKSQRNYKDTLFRMLFKEKENLLSLYNALNKTAYTNVDDLDITTLENAIYMNYKNDISFVFDYELMLYEHQSTVNPNMPLRDLIYVSTVLKGITKDEDLYGTKLIQIPSPRFVVFYNGADTQPEHRILKLSDAYKKKQEHTELELEVMVYNINWGHNTELMEACQLLKEYAQYINKVRTYAKSYPITEAIEKAVDDCIQNNILKDFLTKNRSEAIDMCLYEYDEEKHLKSEREWAYQEGLEEGRQEITIAAIESAMQNFGIDLQTACKGLGVSVDEYKNAKERYAIQETNS